MVENAVEAARTAPYDALAMASADPTSKRAGPLADLLVLDLSRVLTGPYAAMMLGDQGARVIKVERPGLGDDTREWGPPFVGEGSARESTYFLSTNRNKESLVLDLKDPGDCSTLADLVSRADVLIENFRGGVLDKLGFDVATLHELNPRLVVLSITGFGPDGPEASRAGYDQILQGEGGLMSFTGPGPDQPTKVGVPIADILAGMFGAFGVMTALHERERTGRGKVVRTSLLAAIVAIHTFQGTRFLVAGELPEPCGNRHPTVSPYGAFRCSDGIVQIAVGNDAIWTRFAALLQLDASEERFSTNGARVANYDALATLIDDRLRRQPLSHWLEAFAANGIPAGEVKPLDRVYESDQVKSQGLIVETDHSTLGSIKLPGPPLRFDGAEPTEHLPPPTLGQHSAAIREWLARVPVER
jgi:crotonobetainyl-CoA:carnitine CoA-transferase CaiB-like acyl-CoA transferase